MLLLLPATLLHIMSWHQPAFTLSVLILYTYFCFYPYILTAIPGALVLTMILAPGYDLKHPRNPDTLPTKFLRPSHLASEAEHSELEEMKANQRALLAAQSEKQLLERLRDLQNALARVVKSIERIEGFVYAVGGFVDEEKSTALYMFLLLGLSFTVYMASKVPTSVAVCSFGWLVVLPNHPLVSAHFKAALRAYFEKESFVVKGLRHLQNKEVIIDYPPEERTVEVFELQRVGLTPRQWTPWVFTPHPYEIMSPARLKNDRPPGSRFLDDVLPPEGWFFDDSHAEWQVDLRPKDWVAHKGIRYAEVDVDGGWVYDWTEYQERGEWRRRRWLRTCFRYHADT